jgi:hypothetical protein
VVVFYFSQFILCSDVVMRSRHFMILIIVCDITKSNPEQSLPPSFLHQNKLSRRYLHYLQKKKSTCPRRKVSQTMADSEYDLEEELAQEKKAAELENVEYQRLLDLVRIQKQTVIPEVVLQMINATQDPLDESPENIEEIKKYVVGPSSNWSSDGPEAKEFRTLMSESFAAEWADFSSKHPKMTVGEAMQKLPPVYYASPLPQSQSEVLARANPSASKPGVGVVRARVHYHDNHGQLCEMLREVTFNQSASSAIADAVNRIHTILNVGGVPATEYMFKVVGRSEYLYGPEQFINFRYIRDCVVKLKDIKLYVLRLPFESSVLSQPRFLPQYSVIRRTNQTHNMSKASNICSTIDKSVVPQKYLSLWDLGQNLQVRLDELSNLTLNLEKTKVEDARVGDDIFVCIIAEVTFGGELLCPAERTPWRCCKGAINSGSSHRVLWGPAGTITFDIPMKILPRESRLCLSVVAVVGDKHQAVQDFSAEKLLSDPLKNTKQSALMSMMSTLGSTMLNTLTLGSTGGAKGEESIPIFYMAAVNIQLFDHLAVMRTGKADARMWATEMKANPISISSTNPDPTAVGVRMLFPTFALPVIHPSGPPSDNMMRDMEILHHDRVLHMDIGLRDNKIAQLRQLKSILVKDPLYEVTETDRLLLWQYRHDLTKRPKALAKFLLAVDWRSPGAVHEAHNLMERWAPLAPMDALELLDARYADTRVRQHAIEAVNKMKDNELKNCILQLVQVLKYEPYHFSALSRFLLMRALQNPHLIGHIVFWHLTAEMSNPAVSERHGLLIEEYITRLPSRREILRQVHVVNMLLGSALQVKESKKSERLQDLRESLEKLQFPRSFALALDPAMECSGLHIGKCKVMDSKKLPLWLVFKNADPLGASIYIIFKAGDDLRQDLLTLQMLDLMDNVWKSSGLDLHMIPYGCVATGEGVGMIEVVLSSDTVANITKKDGGAHAAFSETPLMNWLRKFNRTPADVERCLWNFVYSCAGYCVATYILGIGDRHNDNIMLREDGTLFHIDFGHFLGNFKTKFGFKRETAPFIFTPMCAYMMGGPSSPIYAHFCDIACRAYNIIRRQNNLLIILFTLMLSTGIPELQSKSDIMWLQTVLVADATDEEAAAKYKNLIHEALTNTRTLINDYVHIVAHA